MGCKGLDAVLPQKGRPVICTSRTLTPAETGYSNIDRELLSVLFGLEILHQCVYKIKVQTNHKSLILIWKMETAAASPQLPCLLFRLATYDVELTCLKGKENVIADSLS